MTRNAALARKEPGGEREGKALEGKRQAVGFSQIERTGEC
jgi:hypothetical protein